MRTKLHLHKFKYALFFAFLIFGMVEMFAQVRVPFTERTEGTMSLRGNMTFVSNNILNRNDSSGSPNDPYNHPSAGNNGRQRNYIDIDGDPSTFSSSSADLQLSSCASVVYAGLYWAGNYVRNSSNKSFTDIRFRVPGGAYVDLVADNNADPAGEEDAIIFDDYNFKDDPYVCYKNVTNLVQPLADPNGTYVVANVRATEGTSVGGAGGWTMVVIYEDPTLPGRYFTVFDGYSAIVQNAPPVDFNVSGFTTISNGLVRAVLGTAVLEGDRDLQEDSFQFRSSSNPSFTVLGTNPADNDPNPTDNFFDSNITINNVDVLTRNPASTNTLGYDSDIFELNNPGNTVIGNNETGGTFRMTTDEDSFGAFLTVFAVDILEPYLFMEKTVERGGVDIENGDVSLGESLEYVITFKNIGNDDAINFSIRDVLPANVNYLNIDMSNAHPDMTATYIGGTNEEVLFEMAPGSALPKLPVPDDINSAIEYTIRIGVQVASDCYEFRDACSNVIQNQAFASYVGAQSGLIVSDDPSIVDIDPTCLSGTPSPANIIANIDTCNNPFEVTLCGDSADLTAGSGYAQYELFDSNGISIAGPQASPTFTVTQPGLYTIDKELAVPCQGSAVVNFTDSFDVQLSGTTNTNPVIPYADEVVECNDSGTDFPKIFLCGASEVVSIATGITDTDSIEWEILDEASCANNDQDDCPTVFSGIDPGTGTPCGWGVVGTGPNFDVEDPGQYRITLRYQNGCFTRFYFDVFENDLDPQVATTPIICDPNSGSITITNVPSDYEYALDDDSDGAFGPSNQFTNVTGGSHIVYIRQDLDPEPPAGTFQCVFEVPVTVPVRNVGFNVTPQHIDCAGDTGQLVVQMTNAEPDYTFILLNDSGVPIDSYFSNTNNTHTFTDLNAGTYTVRGYTNLNTGPDPDEFDCFFEVERTINPATPFSISAVVTENITCNDGEIRIDVTGGTPDVENFAIYSINGTVQTPLVYQFGNTFTLSPGEEGSYQFIAIDGNGCDAISPEVTIDLITPPTFIPVPEDVSCSGITDGEINFTSVVNPDGTTLTYYITGPVNQSNNTGNFTGLPAGNYTTYIEYIDGTSDACPTPTQPVTIDVPDPLDADITITPPTCTTLGSIEFTNPSGGSGRYQYNYGTGWFPAGGTTGGHIFNPVANGNNYQLQIRDFNNQSCTQLLDTRSLIQPASPVMDPITPPTITCNAGTNTPGTGTITVSSTGGTGTLTYEITAPSAQAPIGAGNEFDNLTPGVTYTVRVTDSNGCFDEETVRIPQVTPITLTAPDDDNICFGATNGELTFTVGGIDLSSRTYSYTVNGVEAPGGPFSSPTILLSNLPAGDYEIRVTDNTSGDATGCTTTAEASINVPDDPITFSGFSSVQPNCSNGGVGSATITASGGWAGFDYQLVEMPAGTPATSTTGTLYDFATNGSNNTFTNLAAGSYQIQVQDANGCPGPTQDFTLTDAVAPTVTLAAAGCYDPSDPNSITLTATPTPAVGNYEYSTTINSVVETNTTGVFDTNVLPGTYVVRITDLDSGCFADSNSVTVNPELALSVPNVTISACATTADIISSGSGGSGAGTYVYAIVDAGATAPADGDYLAANSTSTQPIPVGLGDTFDVYVRDNGGASPYCQVMETVTVTRNAAMTIAPIGPIALACNGDTNGQINASGSVTNGRTPYQYELSGGTLGAAVTNATGVFDTSLNLGVGSYTLTVRDNTGNAAGNTNFCEESITIEITEPTALNADADDSGYDCDTEATITVENIVGGSGSYEVRVVGETSWITTALPDEHTFTQTFTDGTYTVEVRDVAATSCIFPITVVVDPLPVAPSLGQTIAYNCDGTGNITVTPFDATYEYQLEDGGSPFVAIAGYAYTDQAATSDPNIFTDVPPGNYIVRVDYGAGTPDCTETIPVSVSAGNVFAMEITSHTDITCNGANDGTITFEVTNFSTGGYQYSTDPTFAVIIGTSTNPEETVSGLSQGTTTIYVRDTRDTSDPSCNLDDSEDIDEPAPIVITADVTQEATCNNGNEATIEVLTAVGGSLSYEYELIDLGTGLPFGSYDFGSNGSNDTFTDVPVGNYEVRVRDAVNITCTGPAIPVQVVAPEAVVFNPVPTDCYDASANNGQMEILVTNANDYPGGTYSFSINAVGDPRGPFVTSNGGATSVPEGHTFTNLSPGNYEITVRDAYGCETTLTRTINDQIIATANLDNDLTCLVDAQITISHNGVGPSFIYEVGSTPTGPFTVIPNAVFNNVSPGVFSTDVAGNYYFRVTDSDNCSDVTNLVTVTPADDPVITNVIPTNVNCFGDSTGALEVIIDTSVGIPPYTIEVFADDGLGNPTGLDLGLNGLPAGDYHVIVTDSKSCPSAPFAVEIIENPVITPNTSKTDVSCSGTSGTPGTTTLGEIVIDATGGTGPYIYTTVKDDNSFTDTYDTSVNPNLHTLSDLAPGDYTITVTDDLGCSVEISETIAAPPGLLLTTSGAAGCEAGSGTMIVEAQADNGVLTTGDFYFSFYPPAAPFSTGPVPPNWNQADIITSEAFPTAFEFTGLNPGVTYSFIVHDALSGCEYMQEATVPVATSSTLLVDMDPEVDITCTGFNDGSITFTADGSTTLGTTIDYQVYNAIDDSPVIGASQIGVPVDTPITQGGLAPGTYYVLFTEEPVAPAVIGCVSVSPDFLIDQAPVLLNVTATSNSNDNNCSVSGNITASAQNGEGPYDFILQPDPSPAPIVNPAVGDPSWNSTNIFTVDSGDYVVFVKDANDCIQYDQVTVLLDPSPEISTAIDDNCVAEGTFSATVTLDVAGMPPYTLSVNGQPAQPVTFPYTIENLSSGLLQTVDVFDVNGCGEQEIFDIYPPMDFTPTVTEILDCETPSPANNAVIRIVTTQGTGVLANYEYEINAVDPLGNDQAATPLPSFDFTWNLANVAGDYIITVRDAGNPNVCPITRTVNVPELIPPVLNLVDSGNESCNPSSTGTPPDPSLTDDGFITVRVDDNGFGPFTFEITGGTLVGAGPTLPSDGYTATFSGLDGSGGITYTIQATSTRNNCVTNTIVRQITEPDPITFTLTPTPFTCTDNSLGNAQLAVTDELGGSGPPYRYEFILDPSGTRTQVQNGTNPNYIITDISGGTYQVNVYDSNGCVGTDTETIPPVFEIADPSVAVATPIVCGGTESINVTLNTVNNPAAIALALDYVVTETDGTPVPASSVLGSSNNPQLISGLDIGSYVITITNNLTGCSVVTNHTVVDPNTFTIDVDITQHVICVGASDGAIDITLVNDPAPATPYPGGISWTIFDTNGTLGTTPADTADDTPVAGASGSSLTNTDSYTGLPAGDYNIVVTQDNDPTCSNIESFSIIEPSDPLTANVDVTPITCTDDGIITIIDQAGGWPGYTYYINLFSAGTPAPIDFTAGQISRNIPVADAGVRFQAWIMDSEGCPVLIDDNIVLNAPSAIDATVTPTYNCTTGTDGQIEVTATVGGVDATPNVYTYQLYRNGSPYEGPVTQTTPGPPDALFTDLGPGSYQVRIEDQYGCFEFLPTAGPIEFYELMNAQPEVTSDLTCNPGSDGEITITVTGGSGNFQFDGLEPDGITALAPPTVTLTGTGVEAVYSGLDDTGIIPNTNYTFTITDLDTGSSCTTSAAISLVEPQNPAVLAPTVTDVSCASGVNDGTVQINLDPGTSVIDPNIPYTYTLTLGPVGFTLPPPNNTGYFDELAAGDYEYTVISNIGCPAPPPLEFTIGAPAPLTIDLGTPPTDFMCTSDNTPGIITITATAGGGSGPGNYLYSIDRNGTSSPFGTNNVFQISDSGVNQTVTITVRDANSSATCTASDARTLTTIPQITDVTFVEGTELNCVVNPGTVEVTVVGGSGDFTIRNLTTNLSLPATAPDFMAEFDITEPGSYTFEVTDNITDCTFLSDPYVVDEFNTITATATDIAPVVCMGGNEGIIEFTVSGYTGDYFYEIRDENGNSIPSTVLEGPFIAPETRQITGLTEGSYTVRIQADNSPFCIVLSNVAVVQGPGAPLTVQLDISNELTCNGNDGALTAVAQGGWPGGYEYRLLIGGVPHATYGTFSAQNTFTDLTAGNYDVEVRDIEGCRATDDEQLVEPTQIVATAAPVDGIRCEGDATASIEVTSVSGGRGTGFYQYILNNVTTGTSSAPQPESETLFTDLSAGIYTITVRDGWNCDFTTPSIEFTDPDPLTANLIEFDPISCSTQAELHLTGVGGTPPYEFSQSETGPFIAGTLNGGTTISYPVDDGMYRFYVRDVNGCIAISNAVTIEALDPLQIQLDLSSAIINCTGQATATIRANAIGGLGEYFYSLYLSTDMTTPIRVMQTSGIFEDLPANVTGENYVVRVNSRDCEEDINVPFISEPPLLEIVDFDSTNVSCTGEGDGAIFMLAEGGTGVIKYAISPRLDQFDETNTFMNLTPGLYTVIAQDENGCFRRMDFTIEEPAPVTITEGLLQQELCAGDLTGTIEVLIEGGTAPYTAAITYPGDPNALVYEPVTDTGDPTIAMPHTFSGLAGGITYTILVNDVNDCNSFIDITLDPSFDLTANVAVEYGCTDNFSTNTVTVNVIDPTAAAEDLIYTLNGVSQLENVFTNVPPGDHIIEILAPNGCVNNDPDQVAFNIEAIADLGIEIFESNLNEFTYNGTGGVPPYEYYVDGVSQGTDNTYRINRTDTYTVRVVDSNGCEFTDTIFIEFYDIEVPPVFTPDNDGINDEWEIINDEGFPNMVTKVYDRYGRWLATMRPGDTWKGMYDGKPLPSGDYWYVIKINGENDPREFIGHFTLYR